MPSNTRTAVRDMTAHQPARGVGMNPLWQCLGCGHKRDSAGSRGKGITRRCAVCVARKESK